MPYRVERLTNGKLRITSPHGVKAKASTPTNAKRQLRLLRAVEHGWTPTHAD